MSLNIFSHLLQTMESALVVVEGELWVVIAKLYLYRGKIDTEEQ